MPRSEDRWPQHPAHRIQESTVREAVLQVGRAYPGTRSYEPQISSPEVATSPLELEDGTIVTRHVAFYDIDAYDDETAVYYTGD